MRILIYIGLTLFSLAAFAADNLMSKIETPENAVNFTLPDLEGNKISLKDYEGKYVLINFWAQWCAPCIKEMPDMEVMYKSLQGKNFEIIAIHAGPVDQNVAKFLADKDITFKVVVDEKTNLKEWKVPVLPMSYLVSPEGKLIYKAHGAIEWNAASMLRLMSNDK